MKLSTKIGVILSALVVLGGSFGIYKVVTAPKPLQTNQEQPSIVPPGERGMVGATISTDVTRYETSLQSKITAAATSMTLNSDPLFDKTGTYLTGLACFTIDEGNTKVEDVCGTASGTSITVMTRGISPVNGTSSVASLAFEHRKGASVKITDSPKILVLSRILNGSETIPNPLRYDSSVSTSTLASNSSYLVDYALLAATAISGGVNATTTQQGFVQFATGAQVSSGTLQGSTGAFLVAPNWIFNSTPGSATTVPVTGSNGKLAQGFIDLTQSFTTTGAWTFNTATTTFNSSTTFLSLPVIQASTPSATLATQLIPKQYVDGLISTLASSTEAVSFTANGNSQGTSTGMTLTTDGNQLLAINYSVTARLNSDTQTHTENVDILIDNTQVVTYQMGAFPNGSNYAIPAGINFVSVKLSSGSHTVKYRFRDTTSGSNAIAVSGVGSVYTIR